MFHYRRFGFSSRVSFAVALTIGLWLTETGATLYVYRLGGGDMPAPEFPEGWDAQFVQLEWNPLDERHFGAASLVEESEDGSIAPESFSPDVNLVPLLRGRENGWIKASDGYTFKDDPLLDFMFDGDLTTAYDGAGGHFKGGQSCPKEIKECNSSAPVILGSGSHKAIWFDIGGTFPIRRIVLQPTPKYFEERVVKTVLVGTNDGDPLKDGTRPYRFHWREGWLDFELAHIRLENTVPLLDLDMRDTPARHILFEAIPGPWEVSEFEIYGTGFAPVASYASNIINLEAPASLGSLHWSGARGDGAEVTLTTRSGSDADPNFYWRHTFRASERTRFDARGRPLTRSQYEALEGGEQAGISPDTQSWEFWTPPLDFDAGTTNLATERPRQYVQFNVDFVSQRPVDVGARLDFLEFNVSKPPIVSRAVAEISPSEVPAREVTRFVYTLLPDFASDDLGFDSIEIDTPIQAVSVDTVILSSPSDGGQAQTIDTLDVSDIAVIDPQGGFVIPLPDDYRRDTQSSLIPLRVIFRAQVFQYGTVFEGRVFDRNREWEVRQRVLSGDADPLVDGNTVKVSLTEVAPNTIGALRLSSPVLTPNGDGANDELRINYDLVNMVGSVPVTMRFYDLTGREVAVIGEERASGRWMAVWDGKDRHGDLLPPGIYILRMDVDTDGGNDAVTETVALVY